MVCSLINGKKQRWDVLTIIPIAHVPINCSNFSLFRSIDIAGLKPAGLRVPLASRGILRGGTGRVFTRGLQHYQRIYYELSYDL